MSIKEAVLDVGLKVLPVSWIDYAQGKRYIQLATKGKRQISKEAYYVNNKDGKPVTYILFRVSIGNGLFANALRMLFYFDWAMKNGLTPLVVIGHKEKLEVGEYWDDNEWEYCFEQSDIRDVLEKENVIVCNIDGGESRRQFCKYINNNFYDINIHAVQEYYREYYEKIANASTDMWNFNKDAKNVILRATNFVEKEDGRVLGVALREEFSLSDEEMSESQKAIYGRHPKALSLEDTLQLIYKYMEMWECEYVFISTMFQESMDYFIDKLQEKVIFTNRKRKSFAEYVENNKKICEDIVNNSSNNLGKLSDDYWKNQHRQNELDYLEEVSALSTCDYCMGVKSSGLIAALAMNGGRYKDVYIFEDCNKVQRY